MFSGFLFFLRSEVGPRSTLGKVRRRQRKLRLETLENRRLLATFSESGPTLDLILGLDETLTVVSTPSDTYSFTLGSGAIWNGADSVRISGQGTSVLTVTAAGKAALDTIRLTDSAAVTSVTFADSGGNLYSDRFSIVLDNASTTVSFQGESNFGTAGVTVATLGPIIVSGASPVGALSVSDGNIELSANGAGNAAGNFTGIHLSAGSSITTNGTGEIRLLGRGAGGLADTLGIAIDAGAVIRSTSSAAGAGAITVDGTGGTGSNNDGVRVTGSNAGIRSVVGAIQIQGTALFSGFGVNLQSNRAVESSGTAEVVLTADSISLTGTAPVVVGTQSGVTVRPKTVGTSIDLGAVDAPGKLGLTDAELDRIAAQAVQVGDPASGPITVSAAVTHPNNLFLASAAGLTFQESLTVPAIKTLTLQTGGVASAAGDAVDVLGGTLWLDTQAAVGAVGNPLTVAIDRLGGTVGGDLFIRENDGVLNKVQLIAPFSAGNNSVHLIGGQFILQAADVIDDASRINVAGGILDLSTWHDTVGGLTLTSGQIVGGGPDPDDGLLASWTDFEVESGVISAKLAGSVALNKTTSGVAILAADNTYTGAITIRQGVLSINKDSCLGTPPANPTPNHLVINGGTLRWTGFLSLAANRGLGLGSESGAGSGTIDVASGNLTYDGVIADRGVGPAKFVKTGPGALTLRGVNTYSGGTLIEQGELRISADRALGVIPAVPVADHVQLRGVLTATANFELAANRGIVLGLPEGTGTGTISVATNRTLSYRGVIADAGSGADSLAKRGLGTLALGGNNTFRGGTDYADANSGIIRIDHANALGSLGTIRFPGSGTLRYGAGITIDLSSRIVTGLPTVRTMVDTNGENVVFASAVAGGGRLEKWGAGQLSLMYPGINVFYVVFVKGGELALPQGTLRLTGATSETIGADVYGPASLLVDNAVLNVSGGSLQTADSLLIGYLTGGNARLDLTGGEVQVGGDLSTGDGVPATVDISGAATQVLVARDLIAGSRGGNPTVDISGGTVQVTGHLTAGDSGSPTVNIRGGTVTAASLRHLNRNNAIVNLTGGEVNVGEAYLATANDVANDSLTINLDAGGLLRTDRMYLNRTGGTQPQVVHTFVLRFDGGMLKPLSAAVDNLLDDIIVAPNAGGALVWEAVIEDGGAWIDTDGFNANLLRPLVHDADLVGVRDGGLTKQGSGTLTLHAVNTLTGPVRLTADTLALVNGASSNTIAQVNVIDVQFGTVLDATRLDNGSVTGRLILADGQTLKGTGTVRGRLTAAGGSTVAPGGALVPVGGSPGILIQEGDYVMDPDASLNIDFGGTKAGNESHNHGQLDVTGTVRLNGGTFQASPFDGFVPQAGDRFVIINNDGTDSVSGTFTGLPEGATLPNFLNSGLPARISYAGGTGNDVVISFDVTTGIAIKKYTLGQDADTAPGPYLAVSSTVFWSYEVTSLGNTPLSHVLVTDDRGVTPVGPTGDANLDGMLDSGEVWIYTASGPVVAGQYRNVGEATATDSFGQTVTSQDASHYFGFTPTGVRIEKYTNGQDAEIAPGPYLPVGTPVTWTYVVTSASNTPLANVTLSDNRGVSISGPSGDTNGDGKLDPGETWTYTAAGTATEGQYNNEATATGIDVLGQTVSARDASHYFGVTPTGIRVEKSTNGQDADVAPGPYLPVGTPVTWTYVVTSASNTPLANVTLSDNRGVSISEPSGDPNGDGKLDPGETWTYTAAGTATEGQYSNEATATGIDVLGQTVSAQDASHYFGVRAAIEIEKLTNGTNNDAPPGRPLRTGSVVTWTYHLTNPGNVPLRNVTLTDDQPGVQPQAVLVDGWNIGDIDRDDLLDPGEDWGYVATGVVVEGPYANTGIAMGVDSTNTVPALTDRNTEHYYGMSAAPILVLAPEKNAGTPQYVKVVNSETGETLSQFVPYESNYVGGARVAVADLNGDGTDEIITAPGRNRVPEVRVFNQLGQMIPEYASFLGYDSAFTGGVHLTAGDVDGDGELDIITVPSYGAANVRVFYADHGFVATDYDSFQAFPTVSVGGVVVAAADMGHLTPDGSFINQLDGRAEIVVATGSGTKATVSVFDLSGATPTRVQTFYPFTQSISDFLGGVSLDVARIDDDAIPDIVVGMGVNGRSRIEIWSWDKSNTTLAMLGAIPGAFTGTSDNSPVNVAVMDTNGDAFADRILAVQGSIGTVGEIHRFDIIVDTDNPSQFTYRVADPLAGFSGPWFIATSRSVASASGMPSSADLWTNPRNSYDVNDDGIVTPLDVLETTRYINANPGQTELPARQLSPPLYLDTNSDALLSPQDALVVINYLNRTVAGAGEGEASGAWREGAALLSAPEADTRGGWPRSDSLPAERASVRARERRQATGIPEDAWQLPVPPAPLRPVVRRSNFGGQQYELLGLEEILADIAAEIAAARP